VGHNFSMRYFLAILFSALTAGLIFLLDRPLGALPPLGPLLGPQHGFWQNAESKDHDFGGSLSLAGLKGKVDVQLDDRLVPHVFAENDEDLYFVQGYLHARFRLFQIDLQTRAAEGRASEFAGDKAIRFDREQRRLGMRFAAENALAEVEKDPESKLVFDAYTRGVNAYIDGLTQAELPLEYKLLGVQPERWSNIRSALLLKMMARNLSSGTEIDLSLTNAKSVFLPDELKKLYPQVHDSLMPIIPAGTPFPEPGITPVRPANADSILFGKSGLEPVLSGEKHAPDPSNGSNNWVLAGTKTSSGAPILCNDPHLELSLPSIWYEMQLQGPNSNVYGVSLPGSPYVIIGFNDSIAWGVTNSQRDVKDYYRIKFKDDSRTEYWFDGQWRKSKIRIEAIEVKGKGTIYDTVAYTIMGPVMFDASFSDTLAKGENLAVRWTGHDASNEGRTFYQLNRAKNYDEYEAAIQHFACPGQNFVFASKTGDIAIWQQGKFPARWPDQGLYIMPGEDSTFFWQGYIPYAENPHAKNPERGFLESANQRPVDGTYPYFVPGRYITPRGVTIEQKLMAMNSVTVQDVMDLHSDYFNSLAEDVRPILLKYVDRAALSTTERRYLNLFEQWDLLASPDSKGQTIYECWFDSLQSAIWKDDLDRVYPSAPWPEEQTTMEWLSRDSIYMPFIDDRRTDQIETLTELVTNSLKTASVVLQKHEREGKLNWSLFKEPSVNHLLRDALPSFARKKLPVGGNGNIVNAITKSHGPSWRMVVHLTTSTEAYGIYPGGQNGNPGSRFYDDYIDTWVQGKYNKLHLMRRGEESAARWTLTLKPL
jgi:penicillin amidase